jgi:hypothetical protein
MPRTSMTSFTPKGKRASAPRARSSTAAVSIQAQAWRSRSARRKATAKVREADVFFMPAIIAWCRAGVPGGGRG